MFGRSIRVSNLLILYILINITAYFLLQRGIEEKDEKIRLYGEKESDVDRARLIFTRRKANFFR